MWVLSQSLFLEGYLLFLILKFIWKCTIYFPCYSLIVLSFGQEKKYDFMPHFFWSHWYWMNYTSLWEMRLCHFCLLWAIYVYFFFDTLSLVTLLSLLISLSFLKPLSIVFQDGIWSVCFNVVVCARIQRWKKKNNWMKKKIKKKKRKSVRKKKIKRVLIKFWKVKWKDRILLWRRRKGEKKIVEWKFQKELTFRQILKTLLIIYLYLFLFHSLCFYPTLRPNKVFIWSWRFCSLDINVTE